MRDSKLMVLNYIFIGEKSMELEISGVINLVVKNEIRERSTNCVGDACLGMWWY